MVTNPRIYTTDGFNYQVVWDNCNNVSKKYELYVYYMQPGANLVCANLHNPILVSYNQKIDLKVIEYHCGGDVFLTPQTCKFKIKDDGDNLDQLNFFPSNSFYLLSAPVIGATCTPSKNNTHFQIRASNKTKDYFEPESFDSRIGAIKQYTLWVKPKNENVAFFYLDSSSNTSTPSFDYDFVVGSSLEKGTQYIGQIGYQRYGHTDLRLPAEDNYYTQVIDEFEYVCDCVPIEWNTASNSTYTNIIVDIGAIDILYVSGNVIRGDTWTAKLGNVLSGSGENTHVVADESVTLYTDITCNVSNYTYLEYSVSTNSPRPERDMFLEIISPATGERSFSINHSYERLLSLQFYKKPVNRKIDYNSTFEFKTADSYTHDKTAFDGDYICNGYFDDYYKCVYTKNKTSDSELYIYQKKKNNTYVLANTPSLANNDFLHYDILTRERGFQLKDPDVDNTMTYQVYCTDLPVKNGEGRVITDNITQEQIDDVIDDLIMGEYDKISLYEIANYDVNILSEVIGFKESFQWVDLSITRDNKMDAPLLKVKGRRNNEWVRNTKVTYQLILENLIDSSFNETFDLVYRDDGGANNHCWLLKKGDTWYADGYSLKGSQYNELDAPREGYKVTIKAFSANGRRSQILESRMLDYQDNIDFLYTPIYTYLPTGSIFEKEEQIGCPKNEYVYIDISQCNEFQFGNDNHDMYEYVLGQKIKNSEDIFYYTEKSKVCRSIDYNVFQVQDYDVIRLKYIEGLSPISVSFIKTKKTYKQNNFISYSNKPDTNFGFCIEKKDQSSFNNGYPWFLYDDNSENNNKIAYFGYSAQAGIHNYHYTTENNTPLSKISIFPKNTLGIDNESAQKILLTFSITEMIQKNIITSQDSINFTKNSIISIDTNEWVDNKKRIKFTTNSNEATGNIRINFNKEVTINSVENLVSKCDALLIRDDKKDQIYYASHLDGDDIRLNNKKITTSFLDIYIKNGYIESDDFQIYTLEKANNHGKGYRNRTFKTENIDLYSQNADGVINYDTISNGAHLQGIVLDNGKPVNFYIEKFDDLSADNKGDLIYRIAKIKEEYINPKVYVNDVNTITLQQQNKNDILFNNDFYINPYTNELTINNTKTKKITFSQMQEDTIVNCVLEKEDIQI